jgi:hypothetical protein
LLFVYRNNRVIYLATTVHDHRFHGTACRNGPWGVGVPQARKTCTDLRVSACHDLKMVLQTAKARQSQSRQPYKHTSLSCMCWFTVLRRPHKSIVANTMAQDCFA